jgi:hypothetical protein
LASSRIRLSPEEFAADIDREECKSGARWYESSD